VATVSPASRAGEPALAFRNVSKAFADGTVALSNVTLSVQPGEFMGIVGPSGCGKSTLLRLAARLTPLSDGSVQVMSDQLGYVFQDATLLPWRTVQANVELLGELHGIPPPMRVMAAREAIDLVGLNGFEQHLPKSLSGGMRMRVSIARSLTLSPGVFLFDEPFAAVDEMTRQHLNEELLRLFSAKRFAALFVTHSVHEAAFLASSVAVMSRRPGRIVDVIDVPFPYPRSANLRFSSEFGHITGAISQALWAANT
jgi:NitT/TauT family transport system ATP-binding protein